MSYVPIERLRKHANVPTGPGTEQLAADLVHMGLEEECIVPSAVIGPLVVGKILIRETKEQFNGEVINYYCVGVGPKYNDTPGTGKGPFGLPSHNIVYGTHNSDVGDYVVVCLPGAVLSSDFRTAARKTYGHVSDGMICLAHELGIGEDHPDITMFQQWSVEHDHDDEEPPAPGTDTISILGPGEEILKISVAPGRGYCFAIRGVAREYSHSTGARFIDPAGATNTGLYSNGMVGAGQGSCDVVVPEDPRSIHRRLGCDRYVAHLVHGIDPSAPSPTWMQDRLIATGMWPTFLAVDVTDYVISDPGRPLHAFDVGRLTAPIVVRRAKDDERLTFLDKVTRSLDPEDLVIADSPDGESSQVLVLAGVFGGTLSEVDTSTRDVLIEAARFDSASMVRSSRRHKLPTESSRRSECGMDTGLAPIAAQHAVNPLVEYGGGTAESVAIDINRTRAPEPITVHADAAERLTGVTHGTERVTELLTIIDCTVECDSSINDGTVPLTVTPLIWRPDLMEPAHLAGETTRLDGYDTIPVVVPTAPADTGLSVDQRAHRDIVYALADVGFTRILSYPFIGDTHDLLEIPVDDARQQTARLANPLAEDAPYLRTSVLDSLAGVVRCNVSHGLTDVAVLEVSSVIHLADAVPISILRTAGRPSQSEGAALETGTPAQPTHINAVMTGEHERSGVLGAGRPWDWADAVEVVHTMAAVLGVTIEVRAPEYPYASWRPGRTVGAHLPGWHWDKEIEPDRLIAHAGELRPRVIRVFGLSERAYAVEINLDPLLETARDAGAFQVKPVSTFPAAREDIVLVVNETITAAEAEALARRATGDLTEEIRLFDVFRDPRLDEGKKPLAFSLALRAPDRTLTVGETAGAHKRVVKRVARLLGTELYS